MRTNNPVLSRTDWNIYPQANTQGYGASQGYNSYNPYTAQPNYSPQAFAAQPQPQRQRMTLNDVVSRTAFLLLLVVATGIAVSIAAPAALLYPIALIGSVATFITAMVVTFKRRVSVAGIVIYSVLEGLVIGAWSTILEFMFPGIVISGVLATLITAGVVLAGYRFANLRVRGKLAQFVTIAIAAYAIFALVNIGSILIGHPIGFATIGPDAGILSWASAGIGVILATASLLMDFDEIETGIRMGAPAEQSWRASFGLMVTLIWLYTLILRILSFFRSN